MPVLSSSMVFSRGGFQGWRTRPGAQPSCSPAPQIRGLTASLFPSAWTCRFQVPLGGDSQAPRGSGWCPGVARRASGSPVQARSPSRRQHAWAAGGHPARSAAVPERVVQERRHEGGEAVLVSPLCPATGSRGLGVPDVRPVPLRGCGRPWGSRWSLREPSGGELGSQAWPV